MGTDDLYMICKLSVQGVVGLVDKSFCGSWAESVFVTSTEAIRHALSVYRRMVLTTSM